jgi:pimeloyl-ACP methyl ester carboxylesterase
MKTILYVHGMGGSGAEAEAYESLFDCPVVGPDFERFDPWTTPGIVRAKALELVREAGELHLIAVSIGAWFSMLGLSGIPVSETWFISPIVDMEKLIKDRMAEEGVSEDTLREKGELPSKYGDPLSWKYLSFVREHPISWNVPTRILYGDRDTFTSLETIQRFSRESGADLFVISAEHYIPAEKAAGFFRERLRNTI